MITFTQFGNHGRLGNQLFQLNALRYLADKYGTRYRIPSWKYAHMFENEIPQSDMMTQPDIKLQEPGFMTSPDYWKQHGDTFYDKFVDLSGYFQNPEYLESWLKLKPELVERVRDKYKKLLSKPTIMVGVRRGDYVGNPNYYELPALYYLLALQKFDYQHYNIVFITDDINWCWFHFKALPNVYFPQGDEIEHFVLGTLADNWIISNSTFHFWSAYLSDASRIIQPNHLLAGDLLAKEGDVNFYLDGSQRLDGSRYEIFEHEGKRIDLRDVTFTIPVKYDHSDRLKNFRLTTELIKRNFDTNFIVCEQGGTKFYEECEGWALYGTIDSEYFHRTKMLNKMAKEAKTPIIVNFDCDIILSPAQILRAVELLRKDQADFVYPYEYTNIHISMITPKRKTFEKNFDPAVFAPLMEDGWSKVRPTLGGIVMFKKKVFLEGGGENENFISYGPEDVERYERFRQLDYRCKRVRGHIYHLDHWRGKDSSNSHEYYEAGVNELLKIREMRSFELRDYIKTWKR